jgi:hypothetical protein
MHSDLVPSGSGDLEPEEGLSNLDLVAASLRSDLSDMGAFVEGLAVKLEEMLPGVCTVERRKQGFRGPKVVTRISLSNGSEALELIREGGNVRTVRARSSGGITLKSEPLDLDAWIDAITRLIADAAAKSERGREALQRLLMG